MFNLLFVGLLLIRFSQLGLKPVHHDESINGWFVNQLWQNGFYHYDPTNYHGPLLFYLFQISEALGGWGIESFRFLTVLFSVLTVLWIYRWTKNRFGLSGWWLLGLLLSPGYLFFARSGIHETVLIFFVVMATTAWIDTWCLRRPQNFSFFLYGLTGAALLKETFVIPLALAFLLSVPLFIRKEKWQKFFEHKKNLFAHLLICVFIWAALYSGFGHNTEGLLDFFRAFLPWAKTGTSGSGHEKEFAYFLKLLWDFEAASVGALVIALYGLSKKGWVRGVCLWALGILFCYSLIPYKTPWCLPSMQIPLWIAAGIVLGQSSFVFRQMGQIVLLVLGLCNFSLWRTLNFEPLTKTPHAYVYVQSTNEAKVFVDSLQAQAKERPVIRQAQIQWAGFEPWPFPWWMSNFPRQTSLPFDKGLVPQVDLILVDAKDAESLEKVLQGQYWKLPLPVRDARELSAVYLKKSIFDCPASACQEFSR